VNNHKVLGLKDRIGMKLGPQILACAFAVQCVLISSVSHADLSVSIGAETRYFTEAEESSGSLFINPEYSWQSDSGDHSFYGEGFARVDDLDDERSYADIREALWTYSPGAWEVSAGIGKVFWGVTESNHLVDIVNQTDFAESPDGEAKLGQPMLKWSVSQDWGTVDTFILPYFRERRFPGIDTPLSGGAAVSDTALYESDDEETHVDIAARYSQYFGDWDVGLYYFKGTNREASFVPENFGAPLYDQITQLGASVQATLDAWLWKLEVIDRDDIQTHFQAVSAGFEYTLYGIADSSADLGILFEYNYDSRDEKASTPLQDDVFVAARLTLNDVQDTNFLIGLTQDMQSSESRLVFVEANRRLGESFRLVVDARMFDSGTPSDLLYSIRSSDYVSMSLEYFY